MLAHASDHNHGAADDDASARKNLGDVIKTAWGLAVLSLIACLVLVAGGLYWLHPFYLEPGRTLTPWERFLPLILAGVVWVVSVVVIVLRAIAYARRHGLRGGGADKMTLASFFFGLLAVLFLATEDLSGTWVVAFLDGGLLVLCLMYVAIAKGAGAEVPRTTWLSLLVICASIAWCCL